MTVLKWNESKISKQFIVGKTSVIDHRTIATLAGTKFGMNCKDKIMYV